MCPANVSVRTLMRVNLEQQLFKFVLLAVCHWWHIPCITVPISLVTLTLDQCPGIDCMLSPPT